MLKILINAYACSPGMGSEPGMAWNWVSNLAKFCELYIITEGEFRDRIEEVVPTLEQGKNMHFYYNPVSEEIRKMCWNQGNWRFYKYYKEWQWKTYLLAKDICSKEKMDVLHQLNMIGFREPGYLWKLSQENGVPFVWGPIGGLKQFPTAYLQGAGLKMKIFNRLKNFLNIWQLKHDKRVGRHSRQLRFWLVPSQTLIVPSRSIRVWSLLSFQKLVVAYLRIFLRSDLTIRSFM